MTKNHMEDLHHNVHKTTHTDAAAKATRYDAKKISVDSPVSFLSINVLKKVVMDGLIRVFPDFFA